MIVLDPIADLRQLLQFRAKPVGVAMDVVFAGQFENAFMRACDSEGDKPPLAGHSYYDSLRRPTDIGRFHRCGTFIALSDHILLDQVDWVPGQGLNRRPDPESLGLLRDPGIPNDEDLRWFAAFLLSRGAFDDAALGALSIKPWPSDYPVEEADQVVQEDGLSAVNLVQQKQLVRLFDQVDLSGRTDSYLVLGDDDRRILTQAATFIADNGLVPPIDLPCFESKRIVNAEKFAGGLLNYCPPDITSALAVRSDPYIQGYAARVRKALSSESCLDTHRSLVVAIREQLKESDGIRAAQKIFEVTSIVLSPLPIGPVKLIPKMMSAWLKRTRRSSSWNVLMARMSDIAVEDYLRRTENL